VGGEGKFPFLLSFRANPPLLHHPPSSELRPYPSTFAILPQGRKEEEEECAWLKK